MFLRAVDPLKNATTKTCVFCNGGRRDATLRFSKIIIGTIAVKSDHAKHVLTDQLSVKRAFIDACPFLALFLFLAYVGGFCHSVCSFLGTVKFHSQALHRLPHFTKYSVSQQGLCEGNPITKSRCRFLSLISPHFFASMQRNSLASPSSSHLHLVAVINSGAGAFFRFSFFLRPGTQMKEPF
ncbi:unnamed protein product, partial [Ixodes pacificus]